MQAFEFITVSDGRVIGAQVGHYHINKPKDETEQDFKRRVKLFAENLERLRGNK